MATVTPQPFIAASRMREVVDAHTADGPYTPRGAASEIVAKLRQTDPELLTTWLDEQAEHFVWQLINDRDRSRRSHTVRASGAKLFEAAEQRHATGDVTALRPFLDAPYTVEDGSRRRLAELRHDDLVFVAATYEERAKSNAFRATFITVLAKKVRRGSVQDHFTEEQLAAMWGSLAA